MRLRLPLILVLLGAFLLLTFVPRAVQLYTDWLWYGEIGYEGVFLTGVTARLALFTAVIGLAFGFLYWNLRHAQRDVVPHPMFVRLSQQTRPVDITQSVRRLALPVSAVLALLVATTASRGWLAALQFVQRTPFGTTDPVFGRDIAFYVFTLPVLSGALALLLALAVLALLMVVPLYVLRGDLILPPPRMRLELSAGWHIGGLLAIAFALVGMQIWFVQIPDLLYSRTGPMVGASYADLHARLPALRVLAVVAFLCATFVLLGAARGRTAWHALLAGGAFIAVAVVGVLGVPALVQRLVVVPTELTREAPQLERHVNATRLAWGLDDVEERDLSGDARLTLDDVRANAPTIENVRLWDRDPLLQTFGQLQEIRTYYDFVAVDDDRYWIDGRYRQVLLSPRELNPASLPTRTFINEHLTFTHGMGVTLAPVNQVTTEGLPILFIKDLPPVSSVDLHVTLPQIYYGELTDNFVYVGTRRREFDYPAGAENVFSAYEGRGGVRVGRLARRAMLASRFGALTALLSQDITRDSRVLYYRNINRRARMALPFLRFDQDAYMVITDAGELVWILDAYTSSTRYPYSEPLPDGTSYMRNSVKIVIDAYHGDVRAYIADPTDPLVQTLNRVFPGIFQPLDAMSADLRAHLRYPEDLYRIQTALYTTYHMRDAETFYHREDQWEIPMLGAERREPFMRRIIMRLPDEDEAEFIFMTQFTPRGRDNLGAWMVARNDGQQYGRLRVYRFPRQSLVFGPRQIMNRINQDTEIARQISLWDQRGSEVIRGELLVIPIEEALIYVQPLYLRAEGGRIPELKRVIVAYENQVVMEETLDESLAVLFGVMPPSPIQDPDAPAPPPAATPVAGDELLRRMQEQYERLRTEIDRMGEMLRQLQQQRPEP
ncbi:MAG: UPF0182 family protein [Gemmatimonadetes bacterium]|nr:UPF0182 family protein [Gemmatimonadota bacterium]